MNKYVEWIVCNSKKYYRKDCLILHYLYVSNLIRSFQEKLMYWVENQSNEIERKGFPVIPNRDVSNTILVLSSSLRAWNAYVA